MTRKSKAQRAQEEKAAQDMKADAAYKEYTATLGRVFSAMQFMYNCGLVKLKEIGVTAQDDVWDLVKKYGFTGPFAGLDAYYKNEAELAEAIEDAIYNEKEKEEA